MPIGPIGQPAHSIGFNTIWCRYAGREDLLSHHAPSFNTHVVPLCLGSPPESIPALFKFQYPSGAVMPAGKALSYYNSSSFQYPPGAVMPFAEVRLAFSQTSFNTHLVPLCLLQVGLVLLVIFRFNTPWCRYAFGTIADHFIHINNFNTHWCRYALPPRLMIDPRCLVSIPSWCGYTTDATPACCILRILSIPTWCRYTRAPSSQI